MKTRKLYVLAVALLFSLFTTNVFAQEENDDNNGGSKSKYGTDSIGCITNLSLYRDYFNQWKSTKYTDMHLAESAYKSWDYCFLNCPEVSVNMYGHGVELLKRYKIATTKDSVLISKYVDTLIYLYDQRIKYFGNHKVYNAGYLKGRQALEIYAYREENSKEYFPLFQESVRLQGNNSEPAVLMRYFGAAYKYHRQGNAQIDVVMETYLEITDIIDYNIENQTKNANDYAAVATQMEKPLVQLFPCEKLVEIFTPKLKENPKDAALAKKIVKFFERRRCTSENLYFEALGVAHSNSPTAETAFSMGKMSYERKLFAKSKDYLQEAIALYPDTLSNKIANAYLLLSEVNRQLGSLSAARTAAYSALKYRPNEAMAYIVIGDLYMTSGGDCTFKGLPTSYWAAADKYSQALNIASDEKMKNLASEKLASARHRFPEAQEIFLRALTEGSSIMVECWINESTVIRKR